MSKLFRHRMQPSHGKVIRRGASFSAMAFHQRPAIVRDCPAGQFAPRLCMTKFSSTGVSAAKWAMDNMYCDAAPAVRGAVSPFEG
ncbi:hypothetical protein KCP74_24350 [Salmonella enterica subsp. enterica]|nr:hypothetical protein KCP74_24350 [Salmonella enterica subsp. enterica]